MKTIKVLGSGCAKCNKTAETIERISKELNVEVGVIKEADPQVMMEYGVMSTPAVVVDGKLVHSGSIPHRSDIEQWLASD
ncbi:thioredoxin family protein [Aestuariirhabdus sp. LZHN29]|uniref:thioredoxin family protein n=1 Tax=Aestuariirhabdus sp. LZHN29 TaxID=3417462 RepID=UPI003CE930D2